MKGFIEVTSVGYSEKILVNIFCISDVFGNEIHMSNTPHFLITYDVIKCVESYEEIKQKIEDSLKG